MPLYCLPQPILLWLQSGNNGYSSKPHILNVVWQLMHMIQLSQPINLTSFQLQLNKLYIYCEWAGMDLGISKCAIANCPNKSKLNPQAFQTQIRATNINFRNQLIQVSTQPTQTICLSHNQTSIVPSLQWRTQIHETITKLIIQ